MFHKPPGKEFIWPEFVISSKDDYVSTGHSWFLFFFTLNLSKEQIYTYKQSSDPLYWEPGSPYTKLIPNGISRHRNSSQFQRAGVPERSAAPANLVSQQSLIPALPQPTLPNRLHSWASYPGPGSGSIRAGNLGKKPESRWFQPTSGYNKEKISPELTFPYYSEASTDSSYWETASRGEPGVTSVTEKRAVQQESALK